MRVLIVLGLASASFIGACSSVVTAEGLGGSGGNDGDKVFAVVSVQYGRAPGRAGGADSKGCTWTPFGEVSGEDVLVKDGVTYLKVVRACAADVATLWVPQVSVASLGLHAGHRVEELLDAPTLYSAPAADEGIVHVGMWVWADPGEYRAHAVTAWVMTPAGPVAATATAVPGRLVFDSGEPDAQPMVCAGPGPVWHPADGDEAVSPCMYTYRHSSEIADSDRFHATFSIVWHVSWSSSGGPGGQLPDHVTTARRDITVGEIQAVIVD